MRIIFHIDLNAFYASAEQVRRPQYRNKPLVVAGNSRRGIITTASYEARKYGIHSAMPLFQAKKLCKDLVVITPDFSYYSELSNKFFEMIGSYSSFLEVASIDECFVDMTEVIDDYTAIVDVAKQMQDDVFETIGIQCSIGISPNKFLSKMASDMKKPNGITVITKQNIATVLWPLPIGKMYGIGKKTAPKLIELGITTIKDLAIYENFDKARTVLGKNTLLYYYRANGVDPSKVNTEQNQLKSVGNSTTLSKDTSNEEEIKEIIKTLAFKVTQRAKKRDLLGKNISITLKYNRFESVVRSITLENFTNDYEVILANALLLFEHHFENKPIRLAGVSLNQVVDRQDIKQQLSLFNYKEEIQKSEIDVVVKTVNQKLGKEVVKKASEMLENNSSIQNKYLKDDSHHK